MNWQHRTHDPHPHIAEPTRTSRLHGPDRQCSEGCSTTPAVPEGGRSDTRSPAATLRVSSRTAAEGIIRGTWALLAMLGGRGISDHVKNWPGCWR